MAAASPVPIAGGSTRRPSRERGGLSTLGVSSPQTAGREVASGLFGNTARAPTRAVNLSIATRIASLPIRTPFAAETDTGEGRMSCTESCNAEAAQRLVLESVRARRWRGFKLSHAMEDVAVSLDSTPRRIQSFLRGPLPTVLIDAYNRLLTRWWVDIDRQAAELRAEATRIERRAEATWLAHNQYSLPFGKSPPTLPTTQSPLDGGAYGPRSRSSNLPMALESGNDSQRCAGDN